MLRWISIIALTLFWLGSLGWLAATVFAPPGSRMSRVDPETAYDRFFGLGDTTGLVLLENGVRRGDLVLTGGLAAPQDDGSEPRLLSITGSLKEYKEGGVGIPIVFWKTALQFSEEYLPGGGTFSLRIPNQNLRVEGAFGAGGEVQSAQVFLRDNPIYTHRPGVKPTLPPAMASSLPNLGNLSPESFEGIEIDARLGSMSFGGRDIRAYLLNWEHREMGQFIKLFLSEAGEPLKIETSFGFSAISEALVPLDAYKPTAEQEGSLPQPDREKL